MYYLKSPLHMSPLGSELEQSKLEHLEEGRRDQLSTPALFQKIVHAFNCIFSFEILRTAPPKYQPMK